VARKASVRSSERTLGMAWANVYMARFAFRKFIDRIVALGVRGQDLEHLANVVLEKLDAVESQLIAASTAAAKRAKGRKRPRAQRPQRAA
jgi:hypothetical protein